MIEQLAKIDTERRIVYGWASVITERGAPVTDTQGDIIEADELHSAVDEFMKSARTAKLSHTARQVGTVVHSLVLTRDIASALNIDTGGREGWIVGMHIADAEVWDEIKTGKSGLSAFSIAGNAVREEI